jgi:hypothetical protein
MPYGLDKRIWGRGRFGCWFRRRSMFFHWFGEYHSDCITGEEVLHISNSELLDMRSAIIMCPLRIISYVLFQFRIKFRHLGGFLGPGTNLQKACTYREESIHRNVYICMPCRLKHTIPLLKHSKAVVVGQHLLGFKASSNSDTRRLTKINMESLSLWYTQGAKHRIIYTKV